MDNNLVQRLKQKSELLESGSTTDIVSVLDDIELIFDMKKEIRKRHSKKFILMIKILYTDKEYCINFKLYLKLSKYKNGIGLDFIEAFGDEYKCQYIKIKFKVIGI